MRPKSKQLRSTIRVVTRPTSPSSRERRSRSNTRSSTRSRTRCSNNGGAGKTKRSRTTGISARNRNDFCRSRARRGRFGRGGRSSHCVCKNTSNRSPNFSTPTQMHGLAQHAPYQAYLNYMMQHPALQVPNPTVYHPPVQIPHLAAQPAVFAQQQPPPQQSNIPVPPPYAPAYHLNYHGPYARTAYHFTK